MHPTRDIEGLPKTKCKPLANQYAQGISPRQNNGSQNRHRTLKPVHITGGAVQGSVLGVLDHNAVLKSLDDDILEVYVAKYIYDQTIVETVPIKRHNFPLFQARITLLYPSSPHTNGSGRHNEKCREKKHAN